MARPRKFDETVVMEAALAAFWKTGYAATSMDDLITATGLGKGSLYGAFGDKHQLFLRVFDDYCADAIEDIRKKLAGDDAGARERLRAYLLANVSSIAKDTCRRGCLLAKATAELSGCDPAVAARSLATYQAIEALFVAGVVQAQRHGDVSSDADAGQLGALLLAVLRGIEALGKAGMEEATLRGIVETAIAAL